MYAQNRTTGDIEAHIWDIYGILVWDSTVSRLTDKMLPMARELQQPLDAIYAVLFMDAMPAPSGRSLKKQYTSPLGLFWMGDKIFLDMWFGGNKSTKLWTTVLNGLKSRGVEDIFTARTDN